MAWYPCHHAVPIPFRSYRAHSPLWSIYCSGRRILVPAPYCPHMTRNDECWTDVGLQYAKLGWAVVPFHATARAYLTPRKVKLRECTCGEVGHTPHPWEDPHELASSNPAIIRSWSSPEDGGHEQGHLGVLLGARSELVGLLASKREGGFASLQALEEDHGELPLTPTMTMSFREKYVHFFHWPFETHADEITIGPGVRLLGSGHIIRLPDTITPDRRYRDGFNWRVHPGQEQPARLPEWIIDNAELTTREPPIDPNGSPASTVSGRASGLQERSEEELFGGDGAEDPTFAPTKSKDAVSAQDGSGHRNGSAASRPSMSSRGRRESLQSVDSEPGRLTQPGLIESPLPFRVHDQAEVRNRTTLDWLLRPWLMRRGITVLTGPSFTAGKSTFLFHMIAALRAGEAFLEGEATKSDVALITEMDPYFFSEAAYQAGLDKKPDLDCVEVLYEQDIPSMSLKRLFRSLKEHCTHGTLMVDSSAILLERTGGRCKDPRQEVAYWLRWIARTGLAVCVTMPTRQEATLRDALDDLGPLAELADTVMHLRPPRQERPFLTGGPDLFEGERISLALRRRLTAVSRFSSVPSRSIIELGPNGYEFVYNKPTRANVDRSALPAQQLSLAN